MICFHWCFSHTMGRIMFLRHASHKHRAIRGVLIIFLVVLGSGLVGTNYPPPKTPLKEERVYVGSQFEGTVHCDLEGTMERAEIAGLMATTVRKLREMCASAHPMKWGTHV